MQQQPQQAQTTYTQSHQEHILVVPRTTLFAHGVWQGLKQTDIEPYIKTIASNQEYHPRWQMEEDPHYKQIIPYIVFSTHNKLFVMQRRASASEQRLAGKLTIGIGGHMRQEDMAHSASLFDWARREFHEEVEYNNDYSLITLGLINDDSNEVGKVHAGVVLLMQGNSSDIRVKSELKSGELVSLDECMELYDRMESWSQHVLKALVATK